MEKSDWARRMAQKFKILSAQKAEEDASRLEEQKSRKQWASRLWSEVRDSFKERAEIFNAALGDDLLTWECSLPSAFRLGRKDISGFLKGTFQQGTGEVMIEVLGRAVPLKVALDFRKGKYQLESPSGEPAEPEHLAETLVAEFLGTT
jgi:hypothetical protein